MATKNTKMHKDQSVIFRGLLFCDFSCFLWLLGGKNALRFSRCFYLLILAGSCLTVLGCGDDKNARYKIEGKVAYQGQPVEEGTVTFEDPATGQVNEGSLGPGGVFSTELPAGDYHVSVTPPLVEIKSTADTPPDKVEKKVNNIPKKYRTQEKSGLKATVAKDKRTFDFELKP